MHTNGLVFPAISLPSDPCFIRVDPWLLPSTYAGKLTAHSPQPTPACPDHRPAPASEPRGRSRRSSPSPPDASAATFVSSPMSLVRSYSSNASAPRFRTAFQLPPANRLLRDVLLLPGSFPVQILMRLLLARAAQQRRRIRNPIELLRQMLCSTRQLRQSSASHRQNSRRTRSSSPP